MPTRKPIQRLWHTTESGLVVPQGDVSDLSHSSSKTFLQIKEKALALELLYADSKVPLPPNSHLSNLIVKAKGLSDQ